MLAFGRTIKFWIRFLFFLNYGLVCEKATFEKASFSSEGVSLSNVKASSSNANSALYGDIKRLFFSFDAYCVLFEHVELHARYLRNWVFRARAIKVLDKSTFELRDVSCENDKGAFLRARKFSNIGQSSALDLDIGYEDLIGWRWQSKQVTLRDREIFLLGNCFFLGRAKIKMFDCRTSLNPTSGFIKGASMGSDYSGSFQLRGVNYYYLQSKEEFDFTFSPFFYLKDVGFNLEFRDLRSALEFNFYSEQIIKSLRNPDLSLDARSNHIFSFKANNALIKADIIFFNSSLFNRATWKEMLYKDFSCLNRDYFGYIYLNTKFLKMNFVEKNDQNSALLEVGLLPYLFLEAKQDMEKKRWLFAVAHVPCLVNFGLVLFALDWELRCRIVEEGVSEFKDMNFNNLENNLCLKFDLPMFFIQDLMVRSEIFFKTEGGILDSIKNIANKLKISDCGAPNKLVIQNIGGAFSLESDDFSVSCSFQDTKNFDFSLVSPIESVDLVSLEVRESRWLFGILFLGKDLSYGVKIGEDQFIGQLVCDLNDHVKFKFLAGYEFINSFWTLENFKSENTYFFIGLDLKSNAWQFSINFGLKNIQETKKGAPFLGGSISMLPWIKLDELEPIFEDIKKEKKELLALQDEFK